MRILGKERRDCLARRFGDGVEVEAIEGDDHVPAAGTQDAVCLRICADLVREEHDSEEAKNKIKGLIVEGELLGVRGLKGDAF